MVVFQRCVVVKWAAVAAAGVSSRRQSVARWRVFELNGGGDVVVVGKLISSLGQGLAVSGLSAVTESACRSSKNMAGL